MLEWNVVVGLAPNRFRHGFELLEPLGELQRSEYLNIVVMRVAEPLALLDELQRRSAEDPLYRECLTRVIPVATTFKFQSPQQFEAEAQAAVTAWVAELAGCTFHVRMRRRGFKGRLSSMVEEQFLDHFLIEQVALAGGECGVSFADPDYILALESVGQRAGLSLWSREQLQRYPLLKLD